MYIQFAYAEMEYNSERNWGSKYCRAGAGALIRNLNLPVVYALLIWYLHEVPRVMGAIGSTLVVTGSTILGFTEHDR